MSTSEKKTALGGIQMTQKICRDCKFFKKNLANHGVCNHPSHGIDLVYGQPITQLCELSRSINGLRLGLCGMEGTLYEPDDGSNPPPCEQCGGSGTYRPAYALSHVACDACTTSLPNSTTSATTAESVTLGSKA